MLVAQKEAPLAAASVDGISVRPAMILPPLTRLAILDAATLESTDVSKVATELYRYYWEPATTRLRRNYESPVAFHGEHRRAAAFDGWQVRVRPGWWYLHLRDRPASRPQSRAGFKLYISPRQCDLPEVTRIVAPILRDHAVRVWKVAATAFEALRPDKLVIYLPDGLDAALIGDLADGLVNCEPHGVPLAGALGGTEVVYFGRDPGTGRSWRMLASHLLAPAVLADDPMAASRRLVSSTEALLAVFAHPFSTQPVNEAPC
jgi:hypothetical protein